MYTPSTCIGMEKGWYSAKCGCTTPETGLEFKNRAKTIVDQIWQIHNTPEEERNIAGRSFKNMMFVIHGKLNNIWFQYTSTL